jgi:hypothetical protein
MSARRDVVVRFVDSYASPLVLLLATFFLLELVDDEGGRGREHAARRLADDPRLQRRDAGGRWGRQSAPDPE